MRSTVDVKSLLDVLKGMKPKSSRTKLMRETVVRAIAGGSSIVLLGEFENSASVAAEISVPGEAIIPVRTAINLLSTYPKKAKVEISAQPGAVWFDKLRIPVALEESEQAKRP